jgi:hypothetical protein
MTWSEPGTKGQLMLWRADLVQAVIFTQPGLPQPDALALWSELFGTESPDNFQRAAPNPSSATNASGIRDNVNLTLTSQLGRVDVLLQGIDNNSGELPRIDSFPKAIEKGTQYASALSAKLKPIRLAIVLSLACEGADKAQAIIAEQTGIRYPAGAIDPIYQFNLRTNLSSAPSITVNRLVNWSVGRYQMLKFSGDGASPVTVSAQEMIAWKIDVNTVAGAPFEQSMVPEMFAEISKIVIGISADGVKAFK